MQQPVELVASYWTISGSFPGLGHDESRFDFEDRVKAASSAGFRGMGFWHADLEQSLRKRTFAEMRRILDDNEIAHVEVEFLTGWFLEGEAKRQSDIQKQKLFAAAEALNAKYIKVGDFDRSRCPMPRLVEAFASLCADAREHGTGIAFEFMDSAMIDNLHDALTMVQGAGAENGGVIVDLWHIVNYGTPHEELSLVPRRHLMGVEINDAGIRPSATPNQRATTARNYCGEGEFDIPGFIRAVKQTGYDGRWGVELLDTNFVDAPLKELADRAYSTAMAQFQV